MRTSLEHGAEHRLVANRSGNPVGVRERAMRLRENHRPAPLSDAQGGELSWILDAAKAALG